VGPLLKTKLHIPSQRGARITRPRLRERLAGAAETALTLVSAPAGFGKTTLLTDWLESLPADGPVQAWLSLDERDNDPVTFWTYVLAAVQTATSGNVGSNALSCSSRRRCRSRLSSNRCSTTCSP
jgi:LuxR family maltose regulon positive regulatory protein